MLAMRLCGNGDCAIPIGPTHLRAFIMWGRTILGAVVVVLVVVWLAAIWLMVMEPQSLLPKWLGTPKAVSFETNAVQI